MNKEIRNKEKLMLNRIEKLEQELAELKVKCKNFKYPIVCRSKSYGYIVKFTSITKGEILINPNACSEVNKQHKDIVPHTNTNVWQEIAYDEDRNLYDKQVVWAWDDAYKFLRIIGFYDAENDAIINSKTGKRNTLFYSNYEAVPQEQIPQFMLDAYKNLED